MTKSSDTPLSLRIFVVENHPDTLKYYKFYLQFAGHRVFHATTMAQALAAIPSVPCDVLISDVGLPDGTGWELLQQLRAQHLDHPAFAIAVSGYGTPADRSTSHAAGFRHHLLKPFNPDDLDAMLAEAAGEIAVRAHESESERMDIKIPADGGARKATG